MEHKIIEWTDRARDTLCRLSREIHSHPELSGREYRAAKLHAGLLEECGCDVDGVLMVDSPRERERLLTLRHLLNETAAGKARMAAGTVGRPPLLLDLAFPQGIEPFVAQCRRQAAGPWAAWCPT